MFRVAGHYIFFLRNIDTNQWYEVNDSSARIISTESSHFQKCRDGAVLIQYIRNGDFHIPFIDFDYAIHG